MKFLSGLLIGLISGAVIGGVVVGWLGYVLLKGFGFFDREGE